MWTGGQGFFSSTITKEVGWSIKKTFAEKMQRAIQHDGPSIIIALGNVINVGKLSLHFCLGTYLEIVKDWNLPN